MKKILTTFLLILCITSLQTVPVSLTINTEKNTYNQNEKIVCNLALTNTTSENITVNTRFLVNYHLYSEHEVVFYITGPDGKEKLLQPVIFAGLPGPWYFQKVEPGVSKNKKYNLTENFNLTATGNYTISAHYNNRYQDGWVGRVDSNTIQVQIQ
ncbi:hypothetical protein ACFL56_00110 [Candidatus Margulisiibacteriota bacterium]